MGVHVAGEVHLSVKTSLLHTRQVEDEILC